VRRYLAAAAAKELRAGGALLALAAAGVALGVAAVLSIQLLNRSALGAFEGSLEAVSGEAEVSVLGWAGALPEDLLPAVLGTPGVRAAIPLYRVEVAIDGDSDGSLEVLGVDLLAPVRVPWQLEQGALAAALGTPGWVAVTPELARARRLARGDALRVTAGARRVALRVGALVDFRRIAPLASSRLAVMDVAQVQGLLGARGRLTQIDVLADEGVSADALAAALEARLGGRARLATPEGREVEAAGLLGAFRLNLTALSLVSLLVGGFLVYASVQAALARRREELGVLRAVGATRGQVLGLVLAESAALGVAGTLAGLPLGWVLARANVEAVSGTLRNLYLLEGIERVAVTPGLLLLAGAVGVAGALAGAVLPALDAARRDPRALLSPVTLEERSGRAAGPLLAAGLAALAGAAGVHLALGAGRPWTAFVLALGVLAAVPLAAPAALGAAGRALAARGPGSRRLGIGFGLRSLRARPTSASVAAGALAVSVSMLVGVTVMVGSFRESVVRWLDRTLRADVYVTTPSWRRARAEATISAEIVARLGALPGVRAVDTLRQVQVPAAGRRITLSGIEAGLPGAEGRVELVAGAPSPAEAFRALAAGAALVSEPLARRAGLAPGGTLAVRTGQGEAALHIAGVYRDYGTEAGAALVDLGTFARLFGPGPPQNAALYLAPGEDAEAAVARARAALAEHALLVRSNRTLRAEVLAIFEQTFAVTRLLQVMGLVIAAAGITLSLLVLARERAGESALYRALGAERRQLFLVFLGRGLGIGAAGLALGAAGGLALALVLVHAVNPGFFGWTIGFHVPWDRLAGQAAAILAAAGAASVYPAARASRTPARELSRDAI
jgi:putative ABC transport system permease protein